MSNIQSKSRKQAGISGSTEQPNKEVGLIVVEVDPPSAASVAPWYAVADLVDAFAIHLPPDSTADPLRLASFVFATQPGWVAKLMCVRDTLVRPFGIKTATKLRTEQRTSGAQHIGIFRVFDCDESEVVLGEDDRHLDFRVSVLHQSQMKSDGAWDARLIVTTVVRCHNWLGRLYITAIRYFHRRVVIASLQHAARRGWPEA
ncbi:DUF2867 domain-containing protein [Halopseudomonas pelagia]|uniref:DUF2867 domain-containing protein n=1 Tax=Halopseudomonas pelagia TaxID=553151 RepID=UPI0030D95BD3